MKLRAVCTIALALFIALTPTAFASTWFVDGVQGNDNNNCKTRTTACKTIGHAISLASSGDTIKVGPATYKENLSIGISLNLIGSDAIIDGGGVNTVITISSASAHVTLSKVTVQNGLAANGGGISNSGNLTILKSTIKNNTASGSQIIDGGGGIDNVSGNLVISDSTISGNTASSPIAEGGGIRNGGTLTINNSTITGNSLSLPSFPPVILDLGGGIANFGTMTTSNSTISGNSATTGGNIWGSATFQNTIVANSAFETNCSGSMTSEGYNLSSDGSCNFDGPGDLNNTDPKLGFLGSYGGPTETIPLQSGSPAIDAGNPNGCTDNHGNLLKSDQRGYPRPDTEDSGGCDMGAYESQSDPTFQF